MTGAAFADLVRRYRVRARFTQAQLAERAGISERAVSDIERALRRRVYPVTARALADALDLDPQDRVAFEAAAAGRVTEPVGPSTGWPSDQWSELRRTPLVGRDSELTELLSMLNGGVRLVTVTGPGGIGKSRLAAEVCWRIAAAAPGKVIWVELARLQEPDMLLATLATTVEASAGGGALVPALARVLEERAALLVLDTFETVVSAGPDVGGLLDHTTDLQILVTSRAPLRIRGERELPLRSLSDVSAAELFTQRAHAARPRLGVDNPEAAHLVAAICRRLSGMPLALELAAANVRHMPLRVLSAALERPLDVLTDGERDLPERQRTMRAAIAWSHDLLSEHDRTLFRRLAPFAGGWTLEAAEQLGVDASGHGVLPAMGRLCEQGLVYTDDESVGSRWDVLDPIRDYAAEQLACAGEATEMGTRHAQYYTFLAERAAPRILGPEQEAGRTQLREETANLRTALSWATRTGAVDLALRLGGALWMFWRMEGAFDEGRAWLQRALALPGATGSPHRTAALWGAAWLAYQQGDLSTATALGDELLACSTDAPAALDRRNALTILGHIAMAEGRHGDAVALLQDALHIAKANTATWHIATSLLNLGTALLRHGNPERAEELLADAVAGHQATGDQHFTARSLTELGYASLFRGDLNRAARHLSDALRRFVALDEQWGVAEALAAIAVLAVTRGQPEAAAELTGASDATYAQISTRSIAPDAALAAPFLTHARTMLGEDRWHEAVLRGATMPIEEATRLALKETGSAEQ
ncbi:tetratricopeptide repeat protein [Nostocoides sp. HKS02]|uniref:ATP-binding protein n=1 Tax=Nostocoides sp. HKS02 TaxID=1813880 RepID=UPI0012B4DB16|nr:tetratricopeptide repeat protein [Tetrasphaera sp. HKS02]QGN58038.1 tetratricopeptide repeat protein [Tetrasphaera sp. HKS02]